MTIKGFSIAGVFLLLVATGCESANAAILPPNNLHLDSTPGFLENMTEQEFGETIERVKTYYDPIVTSHGAELRFDKNWKSSYVGATAQKAGEFDETWLVTMYGGLARRPEVTKDAFLLVICHEMGHLLAGFPFYERADRLSSEGQSDYFATHSCSKNIWRGDEAFNASFREKVDSFVKDKCDNAYTALSEQNLCYRQALASQSLAALLSALEDSVSPPSLLTPDQTKVAKNLNSHPKAQCRLDTYFSGSLCKVDFDENFIPGNEHRFHSEKWGEAESEALQVSCRQDNPEHILSARPKCWFKQTISEGGV